MKIADLKQPYRRMAEYLAEKNTYESKGVIYLNSAFEWSLTNGSFWVDVDCGEHPRITEEIKKHFPPGFDFSGEDIKTKPVMQMLDTKTQKYIYTQLAKEGKFDQLPDTCEFSEAVDLEVSDCNEVFKTLDVVGKFNGKFVEKENISCVGYTLWNFAKLPTKKIDFSQFKTGDILEITNKDNEKYYGLLHFQNINELIIAFSYKSEKVKGILKEDIKSITKIK